MSLYDDILDTPKEKTEHVVAGWSSGMKLLQSQLQLKKASVTQPRREQIRKQTVLAPVIDLKTRKEEDAENIIVSSSASNLPAVVTLPPILATNSTHVTSPFVGTVTVDPDWNYENEYDPTWPNDYEKIMKDRREKDRPPRDREKDRDRDEDRRRRRRDRHEERRHQRRGRSSNSASSNNGFAGLHHQDGSDSDEERGTKKLAPGGVAIAPPPSLQDFSSPSQEPVASVPNFGSSAGLSVAAKIMAKYGFKEGQGLGKQEQGISTALQVEKTSKRGGRIISEKDCIDSPTFVMPPPPFSAMGPSKPEPSNTELMRNPSKVVLLRNMVGPGEVDEELEEEVKEECNTKYGDVVKVIIYEIPDVEPEESVRIFVEFKRIESATKAVVNLNGRYFGGRQVRAGFYEVDRFHNLELTD